MLSDITETIKDIEAKLKEAGKTVDDLCAAAGIARTTWQRWRNGEVGPTLAKWQAVERALSGLIPQAA